MTVNKKSPHIIPKFYPGSLVPPELLAISWFPSRVVDQNALYLHIWIQILKCAPIGIRIRGVSHGYNTNFENKSYAWPLPDSLVTACFAGHRLILWPLPDSLPTAWFPAHCLTSWPLPDFLATAWFLGHSLLRRPLPDSSATAWLPGHYLIPWSLPDSLHTAWFLD